jgi:hypothetical protein
MELRGSDLALQSWSHRLQLLALCMETENEFSRMRRDESFELPTMVVSVVSLFIKVLGLGTGGFSALGAARGRGTGTGVAMICYQFWKNKEN